MYEFDSISVSSYEASSLAAKLTERSGDGWDVVAIVPAGSEITAYLRRSGSGSSESATADDTAGAAAASSTSSWDTAGAGAVAASTPSEPAGWGSAPDSTSTTPTTTSSAGGWGAIRHDHARDCTGHADEPFGSRRLVHRPGRALRAALLGRLGLDRARVACRPAVHGPARRLTRPAPLVLGSRTAREP